MAGKSPEQIAAELVDRAFADLPPHEWRDDVDFCKHCGVPAEAVEDGIVIKGCGPRWAKERARG